MEIANNKPLIRIISLATTWVFLFTGIAYSTDNLRAPMANSNENKAKFAKKFSNISKKKSQDSGKLISASNKASIERYENSPYDSSHCAPEAFKEDVKDFIYINYVSIAWQLFKHLYDRYEGSEPISYDVKTAFIQLFKYHRIKNILDIGYEEGCFLAQIQPLCEEAGVELYGIDLEVKIPHYFNNGKDIIAKGITTYKGSAERLDMHVGEKKFDIIVCSGVLGDIQLYMLARRDHVLDYGFYLREAIENTHKIVKSAVESLSDNPASAFFATSFSSFFLIRRAELLELSEVRILYWNTEVMINRKETNASWLTRNFQLFPDYAEYHLLLSDFWALEHNQSDYKYRNQPRMKLYHLWKQSANVAVLQKKDAKSVNTEKSEKVPIDGRNKEINQNI